MTMANSLKIAFLANNINKRVHCSNCLGSRLLPVMGPSLHAWSKLEVT